MLLLSVIIEYLSTNEIKVYYEKLNMIIEANLKSGIPSLKQLAIQTVTQFASSAKSVSVLRKYQNLIPLVLHALDSDNEEMIISVFETFNEFVEVKKVLKPHLNLLIEAALKISVNEEYSMNLRELTLLFLEMVAENYNASLASRT